MRPGFALGLVALVVLGVVLAGNALERRFFSFLERNLSKKLGAPVQVGGVGLHGLGLEARHVRIDAAERGAALTLDRVTIGWKSVQILGGNITLDERVVRASPDPPAARAAHGGTFWMGWMGWMGWTSDSVRFEGLSLLLSSGGWKKEIGPLRGEISREDHGARGRVSVKLGPGTVSAEGTFSSTGEGFSALRLESVSPEAFLDTLPEGIRLDGALNLSMTRERSLLFSGDLDVRAAGIEWEPLSGSPVSADARIEVEGGWDGSNLSVTRGRLRSRRAEVEWSGNLALAQGKPLAELKLRLRNTACQDVIDAIPAGVMGRFSGFVLDGTMEGELNMKLAVENADETNLEVSIGDGCRFRKGPDSVELARLRRPFTHRVVIDGLNGHDGDRILSFETGPSSPHWVDLPDVSPFFVHAILAQEDARFFKHAGFLSDAFEAALARNLEEGRFAAGASTISMQVARNLFLVRDKTLTREVQEVVLTWWLEKSLSKTEILELYLNLIEFGPRVYGIGPASWHYFGRAPDSLSPAEAAFLATVLPSPTRRYRDYQRGELSRWGQARVEQLLRRMWERGRIDQEALSHGLSEARWLRFYHGQYGTALPPRQRREHFGWAAPLPLS